MMLQSSGKRVSAFLLALFRSGLFFIPTLAVLARLWGLSGIEWAQPVADLLSGIMIVPFLLWFLRGLPADAPDDRLPEAPLPAAEE
jgi:Na+-driven multidrug efflux pump